MPDDPAADARAFTAEQEAEYGAYVATEPIFIGGARAFNPGDPVPRSHVTNGIVGADQVERTSAPAATVPPAKPSKQTGEDS